VERTPGQTPKLRVHLCRPAAELLAQVRGQGKCRSRSRLSQPSSAAYSPVYRYMFQLHPTSFHLPCQRQSAKSSLRERDARRAGGERRVWKGRRGWAGSWCDGLARCWSRRRPVSARQLPCGLLGGRARALSGRGLTAERASQQGGALRRAPFAACSCLMDQVLPSLASLVPLCGATQTCGGVFALMSSFKTYNIGSGLTLAKD
jgi:hypothetical protein